MSDSVPPGESLFAFCFSGWSLVGEHEALTGFVTAADAEAAKVVAAEGIVASELARHPKAPATGRKLWVWEVPAETMRAALAGRDAPATSPSPR